MEMKLRRELTKNQVKMIQLMQEGYHLRVFGCFSGHVKYVHIVTLRKEGEGNRFKVERASKITVNSLVKRGLIKVTKSKMGGDSKSTDYELTEEGKEWK